MRERGGTTSEHLTIEDLAGLFGRFEEDLRQTMFVKDVAAASSAALDVAEIADAYLHATITAGVASWGALYTVADDSAHLQAVAPQQPGFPAFAPDLSRATVCDAGPGITSGRVVDTSPPGLTDTGGREADAWAFGRVAHGGECLGAVVLGFESEERRPHEAVLEDAFGRLASALHNARLYESQARAARLSGLLEDADVRMLASATSEDVFEITRATLLEALHADDVQLKLPGEDAPMMHRERTDLGVSDGVLEATFRVMERPGELRLVLPRGRPEPDAAELDFVRRLLSTTALAVEARLLQRERDQLMRAREEWVADLSHDIRTPLASIRGYAELLATGSGIDEQEVQREAKLIARGATAIERLVEDLHTAFRLRVSTLPASLEAVDLVPVVTEALEIAIWHAGRGRLGVPFEHPDPPVMALVDPSHYSRIVTNLATNAFVHNPPETHVWARLECDATRAHLTIADDGLGMDPDLAQRACVRGERGATHSPGSGLGMAIVLELASAIGGQVSIDSAQGRGTAVTVSVALDSSAGGCE